MKIAFFSTVNGTCLRGPFLPFCSDVDVFSTLHAFELTYIWALCEMAEAHMSLAVAIPFATYLTVSPTTSLSQELSGILSVIYFWKTHFKNNVVIF